MHPRTIELLAHLAAQRAVLRAAYDATPVALRELSPAADQWSVAGIIEHLALANGRITGLLRQGLTGLVASGKASPLLDSTPVLPGIDATRVLDRERRIAAREAIHPTRGFDGERAWRELEQVTAEVHALVTAADGIDTAALKAPHPVLGELDFTHWIVFMGYHEARHAAQIRATAAALAG